MPVEKVIVEHKFGILSQAHRIALEQQLKERDVLSDATSQAGRAPEQTEIEKLINKIENSDQLTENELLAVQATAERILDRCKRKAGYGEGGVGSKTNLTLAWTELATLSVCNVAHVQEEALCILTVSLYEAPLTRKQLPVLLHLAEMVLRSFVSDQIEADTMRSLEMLLVRVASLVFMRLYYHHLASDIQDREEEVDKLFLLHRAMAKKTKDSYAAYPAMKANLNLVKEIISELTSAYSPESLKPDSNVHGSSEVVAASSSSQQIRHCISSLYDPLHDNSPFLWHALRLWQCAIHLKDHLPTAQLRLHECSSKFSVGAHLQQILSIRIITESAKNRADVLQLFLMLPQQPIKMASIGGGDHDRQDLNAYRLTTPLRLAQNDKVDPSTSMLEGLPEFLEPRLCSRAGVGKLGREASPLHSAEHTESSECDDELRVLSVDKSVSESPDQHPADVVQWPPYLWVVFIECLTEICCHGLTSELQTLALLGSGDDQPGLVKYAMHDSNGDLDWITRSSAIEGLTRMIHHCKHDPLKDGLLCAARDALTRHLESEKDLRVRESYKITQAMLSRTSQETSQYFSPRGNKSSKLESVAALKRPAAAANGLYQKIATNLAVLLLPRVEPLVGLQSQSCLPTIAASGSRNGLKSTSKPATGNKLIVSNKNKIAPNRTTIGDELLIATAREQPRVDYSQRAWNSLQGIVEDQFTKEVQEDEQYWERKRQEELEQRMQDLETEQKRLLKQKTTLN